MTQPGSPDPDQTLPLEVAPAGPIAERLVGRYCLGSLRGRGASGQVHEAVDALTGEAVAVKFVTARSARARRLMRRELTALRLLNLPGVVRLRDSGEDQGQTFLVMDLLPGGAVDRLAGPWSEVGPVVLGLLETLARVHFSGVLHLDLKPGNILLDAEGRPVITDFGLARGEAVEAVSAPGREGTPRYVAPEQWRGEPTDARADLYALGVVIWELLAGRRYDPARGPAVGDLDAPDAVRGVLLSLLAVDREDRPASAQSALTALGQGGVLPLATLPEVVDASALEPLFAEVQPSFLHLAQDGAALLLERCGGDGSRAIEVLEAWVRSGRVRWEDGQAHLDRAGLAALRWESSAEALALAALGRAGESHALAHRAVAVASAAHDRGSATLAMAVLESAYSALEEGPHGQLLLEALASEALAQGDDPAIRRALYRAERAGSTALLRTLEGARLCLAGEAERALGQLGAAAGLSGPMEVWRLGYTAFALAGDRQAQERWLDEVRPLLASDPLLTAKWCSWSGVAAYGRGEYARALELHQRAIALWATRPVEQLSALNHAAAAALEVPDLERAEVLALQAMDQAATHRHPVAEGRATWLFRAARYRGGRELVPEVGLIDAAEPVSSVLAAQLGLNEAAAAWRRQHPAAVDLARRAQRAYSAVGFADGAVLAGALASAAGGGIGGEAVLAQIAAVHVPAIAAQAAALVAPVAPPPAERDVDRWLRDWHLTDPAVRADVLSLEEVRERLAAGPGQPDQFG